MVYRHVKFGCEMFSSQRMWDRRSPLRSESLTVTSALQTGIQSFHMTLRFMIMNHSTELCLLQITGSKQVLRTQHRHTDKIDVTLA